MKPQIKTQITLRLPSTLNELLTKISEKIGISKNSIIVNALWEFTKNKNNF